MPTCRRCGRIGQHHVCPKLKPRPAPVSTPDRPKQLAVVKREVREELAVLGDQFGDLLRVEDALRTSGRYGSPGERARSTHMSHACERHIDQLHSLHADVKQSVIGEACWRRTGLRPGYFSTCLLYTSPSPRDRTRSRMPSSA